MRNSITHAANAIQAIPQPFRNNINSKEAATAMEACAELVVNLSALKATLQLMTK